MKLTKKELSEQGKRIMNKAKEIRKSNPKLKWTECVKRAAKK
jgi:glutathione synthase/RimK-type ligase-like ATP-grasp enzyme